MKYLSCDFETTTDIEDCRVWAAGVYDIFSESFIAFNNIEDFICYISTQTPCKCYFHNLSFDGEFIISWLLNNGWEHTKNKALQPMQFKTLITDAGQWYTFTLCFKKQATFYDSLKLINKGVDRIAKDFNINEKKLIIDYDKQRPIGYELTDHEKEYLKHDCVIVGKALRIMLERGFKKMTIASNALADFKIVNNFIDNKQFRIMFPVLRFDNDIRPSYKGGYTYVNEKYQGRDLGAGFVLDVNSMYPYVMHEKLLPYGIPKYFKGQYKKNELYPLYIQRFNCQFELKENHLPTLQLKHSMSFMPTEYIKSSGNEMITLTLTSVDLELFFEHYDVFNIEYEYGFMFKANNEFFKAYIDKWYQVKQEATAENNSSMREIAKLMLNSLYGKFGLNPITRQKFPYLNDEGILKFTLGEKEKRDPIYLPVASFVTSYAREKTISTAQKLYDRFVYSDTDSLHILGTDPPEGIDIDAARLGAWKIESTFTRARFIRAKTYYEEIDGNKNIKCAGMPKDLHEYATWENFKVGFKIDESKGKLQKKHVKGGIVLKHGPFEIR